MNLTRLMALGTLARYAPQHGHQIRRLADLTNVGEWGGVAVGALYRELRAMEGEGLVEARAGHGTFVRRRPDGPPPGTHSRLGRSLARWVREAREAGLDDESIESLLRVTLREAAEEEIA